MIFILVKVSCIAQKYINKKLYTPCQIKVIWFFDSSNNFHVYKTIHRAIKVTCCPLATPFFFQKACLTTWCVFTNLLSKIFTIDLKISSSLSQYAQQTPDSSFCCRPDVVTHNTKLFEKWNSKISPETAGFCQLPSVIKSLRLAEWSSDCSWVATPAVFIHFYSLSCHMVTRVQQVSHRGLDFRTQLSRYRVTVERKREGAEFWIENRWRIKQGK